MLLKCGAQARAPNNFGETPYDAVKNSDLENREELMRAFKQFGKSGTWIGDDYVLLDEDA